MKTINYTYPCTRTVNAKGFGLYLEQNLGEPRKNIRLFAKEFGEIIGRPIKKCPTNFVMVNSGSSANLVAAMAMAEKCRRCNKPLTAVASAFTFPTTMSALILAGFQVTLVDVEEEGFNMDIDQLENLEEKPSVVAVTHFLGFPADMIKLKQYAEKTACFILQDACETLDACIGDIPIYTFGDIITWSFYHPHHLSSYGGGAVYANTTEDYILIDSIAHWGRSCKCHVDESLCIVPQGPAHQFTYENLGVNVEISELNACFGRWQLTQWDKIEKQRRQNYQYLYSLLIDKANIKIWPFFNERKNSPFVFPVLCKEKVVYDVYNKLSKQGVEIRTLMGGATCTQVAFKDRSFISSSKNALFMQDHAFFVGCHSTLSAEDMKFIGQQLLEI